MHCDGLLVRIINHFSPFILFPLLLEPQYLHLACYSRLGWTSASPPTRLTRDSFLEAKSCSSSFLAGPDTRGVGRLAGLAETRPERAEPMKALSNWDGRHRQLRQGPSPPRGIYKVRSDPQRRVECLEFVEFVVGFEGSFCGGG